MVESDTVICHFEVINWHHFGEINTCVISGKHIESPDIGLTVLTSVTAFKLIGNYNVKFLPEHIADTIPRIVAYDAKYTLVKTVEMKHFQGMRNLANIALGHNTIETIKSDAFKGCKKLQYLYLFHNNIKELPSNIFTCLPSLKLIYLKSNNLFEIPKGVLSGNKKLERFEAQNNFIEWIDPDTFRNLTLLQNVDLQRNRCVDAKYNRTSFKSLRKDLLEKCNLKFGECRETKTASGSGKSFEIVQSNVKLMKENEEILKTVKNQTRVIEDLMKDVKMLKKTLKDISDDV